MWSWKATRIAMKDSRFCLVKIVFLFDTLCSSFDFLSSMDGVDCNYWATEALNTQINRPLSNVWWISDFRGTNPSYLSPLPLLMSNAPHFFLREHPSEQWCQVLFPTWISRARGTAWLLLTFWHRMDTGVSGLVIFALWPLLVVNVGVFFVFVCFTWSCWGTGSNLCRSISIFRSAGQQHGLEVQTSHNWAIFFNHQIVLLISFARNWVHHISNRRQWEVCEARWPLKSWQIEFQRQRSIIVTGYYPLGVSNLYPFVVASLNSVSNEIAWVLVQFWTEEYGPQKECFSWKLSLWTLKIVFLLPHKVRNQNHLKDGGGGLQCVFGSRGRWAVCSGCWHCTQRITAGHSVTDMRQHESV